MTSPPSSPGLPLWLVCEDGSEYIDRFQRFLGGDFRFAAAPDAAALLRLAGPGGASGVLLDLDFRRTPPANLIDEAGRPASPGDPAAARRLAEMQGILILRALRAAGLALPVLLCADIDDAQQTAYLESTLGPLAVVSSRESVTQIAARMRTPPAARP